MTFDWRYLLRVVLAVAFIWAALAKIADIGAFAKDIHNFRMVPLAFENVFAMALPWIELVAGVALVLNIAPKSGMIVLGGLLVVFLIAIVSAIVRDLDIACGCFGTSDASRTGWVTLFRDVGFIAVAILGWPRGKRVPHGDLEAAQA
jgi:uncharacterized membrane protein YphA (DoxX/SURF4 family)